jgi:hypothetical protein
MNTIETELFSRDFYIALKKSWLAYIKQEVHIAPEYYLFYTLVKGKSPFKVFSPLVNPKKVEIASRERGDGPWGKLERSLSALSGMSNTFTLVGSQTNRQYDATKRKWTYDQTNYDIALTPEQVAYLQEQIKEAKVKVADAELYAHFKQIADVAKAKAHAKRLANPYHKK